MSKNCIFLLIMLALVAAGCSAQAPAATPQPGIDQAPTPIAPAANGKLAPRQFIEIGISASGIVSEVLVAEGQQVQAGQILARLDDTLLALAVQDAQIQLKQSEIELDKARKPADPADLAAAEKAIQAAQVTLANAQGSSWTADQQAQMRLRTAQLEYDYAEADYKHQLDLKQWGIDVEVRDNELQRATVRYENARANLEIAKRDAGGNPTFSSEATVQARKALALAQADYASLKKRPEPEAIQLAELAVESNKLALAQAQANLRDARLVAPIAGVVAQAKLKRGEQVAPGSALVTLADTSSWYVETDNLTEVGVVSIRQGSPVVVKFEALSGLSVPGRVDRIAARGKEQRGDMLYTVRVALDQGDPRLLWGMTAFVQFEK